ncbi:MAG: flagellar protein FliT [Burkholderiaceae bacterium]|nr:flagellar protein FliT [Burkholderiaceae bacterium]
MPPPDDGLAGAPRSDGLIDRYEQIAQASLEMLAAARHGDWDSVALLEAACRGLISELQVQAASLRLGAGEQRRRLVLLRSILADDAEIRDRSEPWLRVVEKLLHAPAARPRRTRTD